jgi:uncharacterized protein (DUF885 family)
MADETSIAVTEDVVRVTVAEEVTTIDITPTVTTVEVTGLAISLANAEALPFTPHGAITGTNVQEALQQLADQSFRSDTAPTGTIVAGASTLDEGDTWYDTNDEQFKVYRETSNGVYEWVPIIVGDSSGDSDTLDAGAF